VRDLYVRHLDELTVKPGVTVIAHEPADEVGFVVGPTVASTRAADVLADPTIMGIECFGPAGLVVTYESIDEALALIGIMTGALVGSIHADPDEPFASAVLPALAHKVGRIVWNGWPTGVAVTAGQHHGGPYPAATSSMHTSVGTTAIHRFQRPVSFQSVPQSLLPVELRD
jgi:NADP-dependent aldehyde dehydrogenase